MFLSGTRPQKDEKIVEKNMEILYNISIFEEYMKKHRKIYGKEYWGVQKEI